MLIRRPVTAINTNPQINLFHDETVLPPGPMKRDPIGEAIFNRPDPRERFLCGARLDEHLITMGMRDALAIRELLQTQHWVDFEARYKPGGRAPYAPEAMLGLILYGMLKGVSSLRGLEDLARIDLGGMWITGGLCPDHAAIGRFIQLHEELITGDFLSGLTHTVLKVTGTGVETVAGDGTVVQAAASRYHTIKLEAAREAAAEARREAQAEPDNQALAARAEQAEMVQDTLEQRAATRRAKGKSADGLSISPVEPEAVVQPQKDKKTFASSYKPSILANDARIIVACDIDPASELTPMPNLLDQAEDCGQVETILLDAGYHAEAVITKPKNVALNCSARRDGPTPTGIGSGKPRRNIPKVILLTIRPVTHTAVRLANNANPASVTKAPLSKRATSATVHRPVGRVGTGHGVPPVHRAAS